MSSRIYRNSKSWLGKPPTGATINWGNPLTKNLVRCFLFNENNGLWTKDLIGHSMGLGTATRWTQKGVDFDGTASYIYAGKSISNLNLRSFSMVVGFNADSQSGVSRMIANVTDQDNAGAFIHVNINAVGYPALIVYSNAPVIRKYVMANWLGKDVIGVFTYDVNTTVSQIILNGKSYDLTNDATAYGPGLENNLFFGQRGSDAFYNGIIYFAYIYDGRALSLSEAIKITNNPYCFIAPRKSARFYSISQRVIHYARRMVRW